MKNLYFGLIASISTLAISTSCLASGEITQDTSYDDKYTLTPVAPAHEIIAREDPTLNPGLSFFKDDDIATHLSATEKKPNYLEFMAAFAPQDRVRIPVNPDFAFPELEPLRPFDYKDMIVTSGGSAGGLDLSNTFTRVDDVVAKSPGTGVCAEVTTPVVSWYHTYASKMVVDVFGRVCVTEWTTEFGQ